MEVPIMADLVMDPVVVDPVVDLLVDPVVDLLAIPVEVLVALGPMSGLAVDHAVVVMEAVVAVEGGLVAGRMEDLVGDQVVHALVAVGLE